MRSITWGLLGKPLEIYRDRRTSENNNGFLYNAVIWEGNSNIENLRDKKPKYRGIT